MPPLLALVSVLLTSSEALGVPGLWPAPAPSASQPSERSREEQAREAVRRGFAAFARGEPSVALEEYKRAQALVPEANLPYRYAAEALVQLGRPEEAIASLEKYLSIKPDVGDAAETRARIGALRATLPSYLTLECTVPKITVQVDGAPAESYSCPAELRVRGGAHALTVRAEGKHEAVLEITTSPNTRVRLPVTLESAPNDSSHDVAAVTKPPPSRPLRTIAYATLGVSAVSLIGALVVDLALLGPAVDDFRSAVDRGDPDAGNMQSKVQTLRTLGLVGYASAAVLGITGGVLFFVSRSSPSSPGVVVRPAEGGAELGAIVRF